MAINTHRSYTEYVVTTPQSEFTLGFKDYNKDDRDIIHTTIDDKDPIELGYTITRINPLVIKLDPPVPIANPAHVVRLQRETNIDASFHKFSDGAQWNAMSMDENFEQILHAQQESRDGYTKLRDDVLPIVDGLEEALETASEAAQAAQAAADAAQNAAATVQGVESIADLLLINNPFDGLHVRVKSYYTGEGRGGGDFYFDSTKVSVNNGVTIFNGWVRDLSHKYLSTYDAGLKEDSTNVTAQLQAIADVVQSNFTLEISDKHLVNKRIRFSGVTNLTVIGSGMVSAKELRDTWTFEDHYGVLYFVNCPYLTVSSDLKVVGAKKFWTTHPDPTQAGDSPISLKNCPHSLIEYTDLSHSVAWGIVAENSPYTIAQFNTIDDVVRQSGINLVINGGQYCKVLHNNISNVGLYGIEWETYNTSIGNVCTGNTVTDSYKGVAITGSAQFELSLTGNILNYCYNGIDTFPLLNATKVVADANKGVGCYIALSGSSTKNVTYANNNFDYTLNKAWLQSHASNFVLKFGATRNQIYTFTDSTITNGQTVYIKDVAYTVSSVTTVNDTSFSPSVPQLKLIVLSTNVAADVPEYTFIKTTVTQSTASGLFASLTNTNLVFKSNTLTGYGRGISHQTNYGSIATGREYYLRNTFVNCTTWLYHPTSVATGSVIKGSVVTGANVISINHRNTVQYLEGRVRSVLNSTAKTSGSSVLSIPFSIDEATWRFKVKVYFVAATTTGSVIVRINGVDSYTISQSDFAAATVKVFEVSGFANMPQGNYTMSIVDTVGDLVYSSYQVDIYTT